MVTGGVVLVLAESAELLEGAVLSACGAITAGVLSSLPCALSSLSDAQANSTPVMPRARRKNLNFLTTLSGLPMKTLPYYCI